MFEVILWLVIRGIIPRIIPLWSWFMIFALARALLSLKVLSKFNTTSSIIDLLIALYLLIVEGPL